MAKVILESQMRLHGLIARAIDNLNKLGRENITKGAVQSRLKLLDDNWEKFVKGDSDLYAGSLQESDKTHPYFTSDVYSLCEEAFLSAKTDFLDKLELLSQVNSARSRAELSDSIASTSGGRYSALPKITLPKFSGKYSEWRPFCDLFKSMVGDNNELRPVEKLQYLKTSLVGDAANHLANIPTTDDNFQPAWNKLIAKYDNKRALVNAQLDVLFGLQPLKRKDSRELENLRAAVSGVLEALRALGGHIETWDFFLVYFVCRKLDSDTHEAWELQIAGNRTLRSTKSLIFFWQVERVPSKQLMQENQYSRKRRRRL